MKKEAAVETKVISYQFIGFWARVSRVSRLAGDRKFLLDTWMK